MKVVVKRLFLVVDLIGQSDCYNFVNVSFAEVVKRFFICNVQLDIGISVLS